MNLMRNPKGLITFLFSYFERHHKVLLGRMNFMKIIHTYHKAFSATKLLSFSYFG
jgi:hypothetical protein